MTNVNTENFFFFFQSYGDHRDLHSFPTRRSSDLDANPCEPSRTAKGQTESANEPEAGRRSATGLDRKSTRLNSSHITISYAVFCLKKKKITTSHISPLLIS